MLKTLFHPLYLTLNGPYEWFHWISDVQHHWASGCRRNLSLEKRWLPSWGSISVPDPGTISNFGAEYQFSSFASIKKGGNFNVSAFRTLWASGFPRHLPLQTLFALCYPIYGVSLGWHSLTFRCWMSIFIIQHLNVRVCHPNETS